MTVKLPPKAEAQALLHVAFGNRKLQMQKETDTLVGSYKGPCAVGAVVPVSDREILQRKGYSITSLVGGGTVEFTDPKDLTWYTNVQKTHDNVLRAAFFDNKHDQATYTSMFLALIDHQDRYREMLG